MATSPKKTSTKKSARSKKPTTSKPTIHEKKKHSLIATYEKLTVRYRDFLARRPHRSFRLTRRRDYVRSLKAPGYIAFTFAVNRMLRNHWKLFALLIATYAFIMVALGAITSQEIYATINGLLGESTKDLFGEGLGQIGQAGLIGLSAFASVGSGLSPDQGVYLSFALLFAWLATVWLLREILAGRKPKLRDGLYNSGAPILSTVGVMLILLVQLLPIGLLILLYAGLSAIGVVASGFGAMLFWIFAITIATLALYWITSTVIALVVVTIPGMYPLRAVRLSSDLVIGRRMRVFLRLLWGAAVALITWALVIIAAILVDNLAKFLWPDLADFSLVPYVGVLVSAFASVWYASYVYLFYRKVVDDDAAPA